jgi:8-oxo-dGTP diphosphatase
VPTPILATIAYVLSPDREQVLLMHRDKRPGDMHFGKCVGLGGKVGLDEDVVSCVRREVHEESGLVVDGLTLRGTVFWPGFGQGGDGWFGFVFRVDSYTGTAHEGNAEGTLAWTPVAELARAPMWESDQLWLPMVLDDDPRQFHGIMPYHEGEMISWSYERL